MHTIVTDALGGTPARPARSRSGLAVALFAPAIRRLALKTAYLWYGLTDRS